MGIMWGLRLIMPARFFGLLDKSNLQTSEALNYNIRGEINYKDFAWDL